MKKIITFFAIITLITFASCIQNEKTEEIKITPVKYKKEKKDPNKTYKKGIEYLWEYQDEIRKSIGAKKSTYQPGYLQIELEKSKQIKLTKSASAKKLNPTFTERGPTNVPGRTRGIAVDPKDNKRWFVGTAGGGVWLTEDEGSTWRNVTDNQIAHLAATTVVISQQDSNVLYVGTGEPLAGTPSAGRIGSGGVFKSTDGGTTWSSLPNSSSFGPVARMIINPNDHNNVLIGTTLGIYRTTNGGANWTRTYTSTDTVQDLDADPTNFNVQYGSINRFGLVKSTNGGLTWSTIFNTANVNSNHRRFETAVSESNPSVILTCAYSSSGGTVSPGTDLYLSRDSGQNFVNLTATTGATVDRLDLVGGQGWFDNIVLSNPFNENVFYIGGVELFKVTINNNNTFNGQEIAATNQNRNLNQINTNVHVDQHGMFAIKGTGNEFKIILANDGGIYQSNMSSDPGVNQGNWSNAVTGKNSTQFYGASKQNGADNFIAGAQDNGSWISLSGTTTNNTSYQTISGGDGFEVLWNYDTPTSFMSTIQFNRFVRYVNNSGALSNVGSSGNTSLAPFYTKISSTTNNPDKIYTIDRNGVWSSEDFGGNWEFTAISNNFTPQVTSSLNVEPSIANPNIVWAGAAMTESGSLVMHVSQDGGKTFSATSAYDDPNGSHNYFISGIGVSPNNGNRAYVLFSGQGVAKILKTEDLGQTWADISGVSAGANNGFPDVGVHSLIEMPFDENVIWAGTDIGIFESTDGGSSWSQVQGFIPVAVYDMQIVNDQVVMATHGRGIWTATLSQLSGYEPPAFLKQAQVTYRQKSITSKKATIKYSVSSDDVSRVKIFIDDVEKTEVTQDFNTGVTYTFDTDELSEGDHQVAVQLFDDTNNINTAKQNNSFSIVDYKSPSDFIQVIDFEASDVYAFNNGSFVINNLSNNVTKNVLNNSEHPYQDDKTYSVVLKQPLTIAQYNKDFTYEDFAIVEPFTDNLSDLNSFYDFVIIEASTDLQNWVTLDKYDARRDNSWLTQSNRQVALMDISDALFKEQSIDLLTKGFSIGDTVVFRFSLVTDSGVTSYGWAIRSVNKDAVASVRDVLKGIEVFSVYPTISSGNFKVFSKSELGNADITIIDLSGKQVFSKKVDFSSNEHQEINVNLNQGVYIVRLIGENKQTAVKKIIIE